MNLLISACLLGTACRYDGASVPLPDETLRALMRACSLVPVCPEILGGLPTPRDPAEIVQSQVLHRDGSDVTAEYRRGAAEALRLAKLFGCHYALLKERSPSCGYGRIHDGTFGGTLTDGNGVTASLLSANGIRIFGESEIPQLLRLLEGVS